MDRAHLEVLDSNGLGRFGYFFDSAPTRREDWAEVAGLDYLARATIEAGEWSAAREHPLAGFCRFLLLDTVDLTGGDMLARHLLDPHQVPQDRGEAAEQLRNRRHGRLRLDSLSQTEGVRSETVFDMAFRRLLRLQHGADSGAVSGAVSGATGEDPVRWLYQWLVVNDLLPQLLDPQVLDWIAAHGTPLYDRFLRRNGLVPGNPVTSLPVPIEFHGSAIRFTPSLAAAIRDTASDGLHADPLYRRRQDLLDGVQQTLRWGYQLNMPSAQSCRDGLQAQGGPHLDLIPTAELCDGNRLAALTFAGMLDAVPLWYYLRREAALAGQGRVFGPLGSHLVGQTLIGMVTADPDSYWHQPGSDAGRWQPQDVRVPDAPLIRSIADLAAFGAAQAQAS